MREELHKVTVRNEELERQLDQMANTLMGEQKESKETTSPDKNHLELVDALEEERQRYQLKQTEYMELAEARQGLKDDFDQVLASQASQHSQEVC